MFAIDPTISVVRVGPPGRILDLLTQTDGVMAIYISALDIFLPVMTGAKNTILLVDDDPNDILLIKRAFKKTEMPYPVESVEDGESAKAYLEGKAPYDDRKKFPFPSMVLLDVNMPRISGHDLLSWIRKHPELQNLPVVMLTSSKAGADVDKAEELGANFYLVKPVKFEEYLELAKAVNLYCSVQLAKPMDD